jgi:hypothetical protein
VPVVGSFKYWRWMAHLVVGLIALPFIVHQNSWYEWANSLWLLDLQTAHVAAHGIPTYFIDAPNQYFYPNHVFYAGTAYSVLAYPAVLLGTWPVFAGATAAAFIAASAGMSWTARNLGVSPRLALLPGVLFAATPYTVSNLYGRGAWTELLAVGALSVALGAATSLIFGRARSRPLTIAALGGAVAAIAGTHNITLLFSALLAPLLAVALAPLRHESRRELLLRHALVLAAAATGLAVCGAFLIPDIWLSGRTVASSFSLFFLHRINNFDAFNVVFDPLLSQPVEPTKTDLHTQTLIAPLLWLIALACISARRRWLDRRTGIALALIGVLGVGTALLITNPSWWWSFPGALQAVQFPFRLVSYLALITVLAVIVLLASPAIQRSRLAVIALVLACGWQVGLAVDLALTSKARGGEPQPHPTPDNISARSLPAAFQPGLAQGLQFRLVVPHPLSAPGPLAQIGPIGDDTPTEVKLSGSQPRGSLVATNVVDSPLVQVAGQATVVGANAEGYEVLRVNAVGLAGRWQATVAPACNSCLRALTGKAPFALLLGKFASLAGVLLLLALITIGVRTRRGSSD